MKWSDLRDWLSHPVTSEVVGMFVTLALLLMLEKHEARLHELEIINRWRLDQEAAALRDESR